MKYNAMKLRKNVLIKTAAFLAILIVLMLLCIGLFSVFPEADTYQRIAAFYHEPVSSLQAVYIGSSNCYAFWNPLVAWHNYGLAVYPYATNSLPFCATEYLIREIRRVQPDAKFIVNVNAVDQDDLAPVDLHYLLHYIPDSEIKEELQDYLSELIGYSEYDQMEFKYPWIRMRTLPLTVGKFILKYGFHQTPNGLKGATKTKAYLSISEDISGDYIHTAEREILPDYLADATEKLLDYCDAEKIDVLFVTVPRAEYTETGLARINEVNDMIRARGYPVLALTDSAEELGLDLTQDYYNLKHMNLHGSIKFTNFLSEYLIENYGFADLRGKAGYESWEDAWKVYENGTSPCILPMELDTAYRDASLDRPENLTAHIQADGAAVEWDPVAGADGYAVYRKDALKAPWKEIAAFRTEACYTDHDCAADAELYYAVVPLRKDGDAVFYGNYTYMGVKAAS